MGLSIRNQLDGTVTSVTTGEVMATVRTQLSGGQEITAAITLEAVKELGIAQGSSVRALIKSTEVSLATGPVNGISIRNQLAGEITAIATGGAMATVKVSVAGGELTAAITKDAVDELALAVGTAVVALVKSTEVSLLAA
jgi:molybdate transport system regulatory protein